MRAKVTVSNQPQVIKVGGGSAGQNISSLNDVDAFNPLNGALLQYDASSETWVASNIIERTGLTINCGNF